MRVRPLKAPPPSLWGSMRVRTIKASKPSLWGTSAGYSDQGTLDAVAVGKQCGSVQSRRRHRCCGARSGYRYNQGSNATAVGYSRVSTIKASTPRLWGTVAGRSNQGTYTTAVGTASGSHLSRHLRHGCGVRLRVRTIKAATPPLWGAKRVRTIKASTPSLWGTKRVGTIKAATPSLWGVIAGYSAQGYNAVAVGVSSGRYNQGTYATAVGRLAGYLSRHQRRRYGERSGSL
jgi:hypothetical protein